MDTKNLKSYLDKFGKQVVNRAKGNVNKAKGGGSKLAESISFKVIKNENGYKVEFTMAEYGAYIDKGVSGTERKRTYKNYKSQTLPSPHAYRKAKNHSQPPSGAIDKWVVRKGLKGTRNEKGQFIKRKSMVYLIARSIGKKGIKGISFFQKPLGLGIKQFGKNFLDAITEDILDSIAKNTITVKK